MITIYTLIVIFSIGVQAFFTACEMAFTSVNKIKLKELIDSGDLEAVEIHNFVKKEGMYLGTTLVGTNIAVVVASISSARIFTEYFNPAISPLLATICLVPITLIFAEIVPKIIARHFSTEFALKAVVPLKKFFRLFYPVIAGVNYIAKIILTPFSKNNESKGVMFTKTDLKKLLIMGQEKGEMEADEVELIHKILDFGAKRVENIMIPLYRISSISVNDNVKNIKRLVEHTGFSRIPVYENNKNNIVGIVNIYEILFNPEEVKDNEEVKSFIRDIVSVNRRDNLNIVLTRLIHQKSPMGIVLDQEEKVVGIITIEDILEEIVGEI